MTPLLRSLSLLSVLLVAEGARGQSDDLISILKAPTRACSDGAVSAKCKCGGVQVTSGFCCSGVAQAWACPLMPDLAAATTHVYFGGGAIRDTKTACNWTMVGTVPQNSPSGTWGADGYVPASAGPFTASTNRYTCNPNGNGNDPLDYSTAFTCVVAYTQGSGDQATYKTPLSNYTTNAGWVLMAMPSPTLTYAMIQYDVGGQRTATNNASLPVHPTPLTACFGLNDARTTQYINVNRCLTSSGAAGTQTPATSTIATLGADPAGGHAVTGRVYEVQCVPQAYSETLCRSLQNPVLATNRSHNVVVFGDSNTVSRAWPAVVQTTLGPPWIISNRGLGGRQSTETLPDWTDNVRGDPFSIVGIFIGGNDIMVAGASATDVMGRIQTIADQAIADGQKVWLHTIMPCLGYASCNATNNTQRKSLNTLLAAYVAAHPTTTLLVDTDALINDGTDRMLAAYDGGDHLHLKQPEGVNAVATLVYDTVHAAGWW